MQAHLLYEGSYWLTYPARGPTSPPTLPQVLQTHQARQGSYRSTQLGVDPANHQPSRGHAWPTHPIRLPRVLQAHLPCQGFYRLIQQGRDPTDPSRQAGVQRPTHSSRGRASPSCQARVLQAHHPPRHGSLPASPLSQSGALQAHPANRSPNSLYTRVPSQMIQ